MVPRTPPCIESIPMAMYAQMDACPSSILRLSRTVLKHSQPSTDFQDFLPSFLRIFLYFFPLNPSTHHSHERNSTVNCSYVSGRIVCTSVHLHHGTLQITGRYSTSSLTVPEDLKTTKRNNLLASWRCCGVAVRCWLRCAGLVVVLICQ